MTIHDEYNIALKNIKSQLEILRKAIEEFEKNHFKDNRRKAIMKRDSKYGKN